ncbi:hypothetical protein [Paenibacillus alginolyticus]|uniref:hypothetical protein n=1 Tax=Paenibacillus alginolyticus TaxID=59839 RepID=UPI0003FCE370
MKYRQLGKTGLDVSVLSFGASSLGSVFRETNEATANERIPTTLVSTANPDNIRNNIAWTDEPMDTELLQEVLEILAPIHNKSWISGRPEYNEKTYL